VVLGLVADFTLPILWSLLATIPIGILAGGWPIAASGSDAGFLVGRRGWVYG